MISLEQTIVGLRSANFTISMEALDGDQVYFHYRGTPMSYDLGSGVISRCQWEREGQELATMFRRMYPGNDLRKLFNDFDAANFYYPTLLKHPEMELDEDGSLPKIWLQEYPELLALVAGLAGHQVKGDDVIKSLRAKGYDVDDFKITRLYLGGYKIEIKSDESEIRVETFVRMLYDQWYN